MEDFETSSRTLSPELFRTNSRSQISFRSPEASEYSEYADNDPRKSWSPPAWRKASSGWFKHQAGLMSPDRSREASPLLDQLENIDEEDLYAAAGIPLPGSPSKGRSEERSLSPEHVQASTHNGRAKSADSRFTEQERDAKWEGANNYIRFSVRADVQHRTEPIEAVVSYLRKLHGRLTSSRYTTFVSIMTVVFAITIVRTLFQEPMTGPTPDLIKVAGLAKSFEPMMYYSENGHAQVTQLGETGVAVWDLGESVRSTNMTSGPIIVRELDELSESLKALSLELTRFFAAVDGDIDSILIVMEWAQRELTKLVAVPPSHLSLAFSNLHTILSRVGVLENPRTGEATAVGKLVSELFGKTTPQITQATLQRTFTDFLGVLEESINNELTASISLFAHFEAIDRQFLNLQRTVIRETDAQEREENEMLASLWSRVIGGNASQLKKFEKNKQLLGSLRERTVQNKHVLVDHNGRLLQLRSNLEILRKKLVSPLVRANDSSTLTVEEQINGLEGTYLTLRATREAQKTRVFNAFHDASNYRRSTITRDSNEGYTIEGR
ncbi:hypothetical protein MBLNU459_g4163t2 [Dothideomycetes sp. NU459]